jgi:hypothetical protein
VDTRNLIDAIMRQTTVLIAQLSTVAGIRAPLATMADQVFFDLAREIEAQGVSRKVAADMFGLALRSYQKKMQRLAQSKTDSSQTLWSAVLEHLRKTGGASRQGIDHHFRNDDALDLAAVLKDLITSGLVSATGRGSSTYYTVSSAEARATLANEGELEAIASFVWLAIYDHQQIARGELLGQLPYPSALCERAIDTLIDDGRIEQVSADNDPMLRCTQLHIPVGAEQGWEAAVFDHFRAAATAIGAKLRRSSTRSQRGDLIGGATLSFSIEDGHPFEAEVYGLLARVRDDVNALWSRVSEHNRAHPMDPSKRIEVTFYFGQNVVAPDCEKHGDKRAAEVSDEA